MGVETVRKTEDLGENESQEQFLSRVSEINQNILRIYDEMEQEDKSIQKIEESFSDQIRRIAEYYKELHTRGEFKDMKTGRIKKLNEVSRTILDEMTIRQFTPWSKKIVWYALKDEFKRAWRNPIVDNASKLSNGGLLSIDTEVETLYEEQMEYIRAITNFDYLDLPKSLRLMIAEHVYKLYKKHDKEWTKHGLTVVKHQDGFHVPDPYESIIRIKEGPAYRGELYDAFKSLQKTIGDVKKKVEKDVLIAMGDRAISVEKEHQIAMSVRVIEAFFKPNANYKWKRDIKGWAQLIKKKLELKSKSGAEKFSRKVVDKKWLDENKDNKRGITREEIAKMQHRLCKYFLQFIDHFEFLTEISDLYVDTSESKRAAHSINMHDKLSDRA